MKSLIKLTLLSALSLTVLTLASCGKTTYLENAAPEESGLNLMKITDENNNSVGGASLELTLVQSSRAMGISQSQKSAWPSGRYLAVSPDGQEIAYLSKVDKQWNIMTRKATAQGAATQRSFRAVGDFSWGANGQLYFSDQGSGSYSQISSTDAHAGTLMRQLTNNNSDINPILSKEKDKIYFTRVDQNGPYVWSYSLKDGALTACCKGFNPWPVKGSEFLCVRNSTNGMSEIWLVDYEVGKETLIVSDKNRGYTNPCLSPDGKWILMQGNGKSSISKKSNLDIFAVKIDGTELIQLTYHPADDCCPVWSPDGKYIYFISSRASQNSAFNVWRMRFSL